MCVLSCGSVSGKPDAAGADGDFTISVNPGSLTVPIASMGTATVTVERTGSVGDIMLTGTGDSNVTVTFAPNPIPPGSNTSQATIKVAGGSPSGTTNVVVTGAAGALSHDAMLAVMKATITVTGTVRGNRSGVKVGLVGKQSVTSGAGGVFMFSDVTPPYDLYTVADAGTAQNPVPTVFLFNGLTRPDPIVSAAALFTGTLKIICGIITPCPSAAVNGTKSGTGNATDPVVFVWTDGGNNLTLAANSTYTGNISWQSGTSTGQLLALQLTRRPSGAPNTFLGYVRSGQLTLTSGTPQTINLAFAAVNSTANLTGTVTGPAGYDAPAITLFQQFGATQSSLWTTTTTTTVDATFPLIATAGGTNLFVSASNGTGTSRFVQPLTATVAVNFAMPAAAVIGAPAEAATGVTTSTHFTWTSAPSTINEVNFSTSTPTRAAFKIFTTASDVTIPVIPELALPANQGFGWSVIGYGPNMSIDEAAASNELEPVLSNDYQGPAHAQTFSESRTFTTAP